MNVPVDDFLTDRLCDLFKDMDIAAVFDLIDGIKS